MCVLLLILHHFDMHFVFGTVNSKTGIDFLSSSKAKRKKRKVRGDVGLFPREGRESARSARVFI